MSNSLQAEALCRGRQPSRPRCPVGVRLLNDALHTHNATAERGVIGCLLVDPQRCVPESVALGLCADDFYLAETRLLFQTLTRGEPPADYVEAVMRLERQGVMERAGGMEYVSRLADEVPSTANLPAYAATVRAHRQARALAVVCIETVAQVAAGPADIAALIFETQARLLALQRETRDTRATGDAAELITRVADELLTGAATQPLNALPSGFPDIDRDTGGLVPGQLSVPAGFPGTGKTTVLLNMAHATLGRGCSAIFSLEMPRRWIITRLMTICAGMPAGALSSNIAAVRAAAEQLTRGGVLVFDDVRTVSEILNTCRELKVRHGLGAVFVDYIQLLTDPTTRFESREQEVSQIARKLKSLATELSVAVVAPSQVNDDGLLRESRAIGQHADVVLGIEANTPAPDENGVWELTARLRKNRFGPSGRSYRVLFFVNTGRMCNPDLRGEP